MAAQRIARYANHGAVKCFEFFIKVTELLPLSGAARGVIPWVKIHYSVTALQIFFGESEFASSSGSKSRHRLVELHGVCHEASKYCVCSALSAISRSEEHTSELQS